MSSDSEGHANQADSPETRIVTLELIVKFMQEDMQELREEVRELRRGSRLKRFSFFQYVAIAVTLGALLSMAHRVGLF